MISRPPDFNAAVIDERKLRDYCLDPLHPRGRAKARVFRAALGIGQSEASWLARTIRAALANAQASADANDRFGARWRTDLVLRRNGRTAEVRVVWIVPSGEAAPRLVTCYVLPRGKKVWRDA